MHADVTLLGRLGADPEIRYTKGNQPQAVTSFSLAVDKPKRDEEPDWWRVTLWGDLAEFAANSLAKGCRVMIQGRPSLEEWEDANGGRHAKLGVTARVLRVVDWAQQEEPAEPEADSPAHSEAPPPSRRPTAPPCPSPAQGQRRYRSSDAGRR